MSAGEQRRKTEEREKNQIENKNKKKEGNEV
jgi:hypothetical protein